MTAGMGANITDFGNPDFIIICTVLGVLMERVAYTASS